MNKKLLKYAFIFIFILQGCGMNANKAVRVSGKATSVTDFKILAIEKFGENIKILPSLKGSYVLYMSEKPEQLLNPNELVSFFVVDKKENNIVYEDAISGASLSWKSDSELWIRIQKGIITDAGDSGKLVFYYDLIKKEKISYNKTIENEKPN
ncbi:MAG: hypothetical protein AB7S69_15640 [Salinivirgaceae bacterium]|jgi:hypothetical protein